MSNFSEHLDQYIKRSGLTEYQLSKVSGFVRSHIALIRTGQRVSSDKEKMKKLLDELYLSPDEYNQIWQMYLEARLGAAVYNRNREILLLLQESVTVCGRFKFGISMDFEQEESAEPICLENKKDLFTFIKKAIKGEQKLEEGNLYVILQSDNEIQELITENQIEGICIEQLICLDNSDFDNGNREADNLRLFRNLLPLIVQNCAHSYRAWYYYGNIASHFDSFSLFPNVILTNQYVILMNGKLNKGFACSEKSFVRVAKKMYEEKRVLCNELFSYVNSTKIQNDRNLMYAFSDNLLTWRNVSEGKIFCSREAVQLCREKMKEKKKQDMPGRQGNKKVTNKKLYLVDHREINLIKGLEVCITTRKNLQLHYQNQKNNISIIVHEAGITQSFVSFFESLPKLPLRFEMNEIIEENLM